MPLRSNNGEKYSRTCPVCTGTSWLGCLRCPHCINGKVTPSNAMRLAKICQHKYSATGLSSGSCRNDYRCEKCGDVWKVDSSD